MKTTPFEHSCAGWGKPVLDAQWGGGISKNPYLAFKVAGAKAGDKVVVNWVDNTGDKNSAEATIG